MNCEQRRDRFDSYDIAIEYLELIESDNTDPAQLPRSFLGLSAPRQAECIHLLIYLLDYEYRSMNYGEPFEERELAHQKIREAKERTVVALKRLRDRPVDRLCDALRTHTEKDCFVTALQAIGAPAAEGICSAIIQHTPSERVGPYAGSAYSGSLIKLLSKLPGDQSLKALVNLLSRDDQISGLAAQGLGELGDDRAVDPLIDLMNRAYSANQALFDAEHLGTFIWKSAAEALQRLGGERAIASLGACLLLDVRHGEDAARILGNMRGPSVIGFLLTASAQGPPYLPGGTGWYRYRLGEAMLKQGDIRGFDLIVAELTTGKAMPPALLPVIIERAGEASGQLRPALLDLVASKQNGDAAEILCCMGVPPASPLLYPIVLKHLPLYPTKPGGPLPIGMQLLTLAKNAG